MTKLPKPPPPSPALSDEEEAARDRAAGAAQISIAWQDALDWAKRGDRRSLATMLRSEHSLDDEKDVRAFLADVLEKKERRSRGKPASRPDKTFHVDAAGRVSWIDKRDEINLNIRKWVKQHRASFPNLDAAYAAAEIEFKHLLPRPVKQNKRSSKELGGRVANIVSRSTKSRKPGKRTGST